MVFITVVIVSKYRLVSKEKICPKQFQQAQDLYSQNFFLVISEEEACCPCCGDRLYRRDSRPRIYKEAGGRKSWILINRLKCTNKSCGRLHNELPDCILPFKHYGREIIEDVVDGIRSENDLETEDYPCESTMKHWKWWVSQKEKMVNGQIRAMLYPLPNFDMAFLRSWESFLQKTKEKLGPGWLTLLAKSVYHSAERMKVRLQQ
jgi:hypothetical protein